MNRNKRGGLGRGIGALIPSAPSTGASPTDIFFGGGHRIGLDAPVDAPDPADADAATAGADLVGTESSTEPDSSAGTDSSAETGLDGGEGSSPLTEVTSSAPPGVPADTDSPSAGPAGVEPGADAVASGSAGEAAADAGALAPVPGAQLRDLPIEMIRPNSRQPRNVFDDDALAELTHSVSEFGVLQPIVVREVDGGYELVMGERRLRAATAARLDTIPAVVRDTTDDDMLRNALLENIHRAQLNPLEEAAAYQQLLDDFGVTHEELASRIGRSRSHLSNTVRLMNLPVPVQRRLAAGVLSAGHARALLALPDAEQQDELATRIVAEGLSVRATEELVTLAANGHLGATAVRRRPVRRFTAPAAADLAEALSDTFDTRVRVDIGQRKGKITVEFASIDDLERIVAIMAPGISGRGKDAGTDGRSPGSGKFSDPNSAGRADDSDSADGADGFTR